jgi:hypothetical protein
MNLAKTGHMRAQSVIALGLDASAQEAVRALRERIQDWSLPVQWFDEGLLGVPLVRIPRSELRFGADFDLLLSTIDPLALVFQGVGASSAGAGMLLHVAVDDFAELCWSWHQDLADAMNVPVDEHFRPRLPLGKVPSDAATSEQWQYVFEAIGQAPFGSGGCDVLMVQHRDQFGRWSRGQHWDLVASS